MFLKLTIIALSLIIYSYCLAQAPNLTISSPAFSDTQSIADKYTCSGKDVNPPLNFSNIPIGTQSMALIVHDPDAPSGDFIHWAVYNIKPQVTSIAENSIPARELINDYHRYSYNGPCPPSDTLHHYHFDLYALDTSFTMNENGSPQGYLNKVQGHILAKATLIGSYKRSLIR